MDVTALGKKLPLSLVLCFSELTRRHFIQIVSEVNSKKKKI